MNKYFDEKARRATYKKWVFKNDAPCNADKMAEAGFIFIGSSKEPDSAKCFYCKKSLDGWESSDDPWKEHFKHASNCEFAKIQKPQDDLTLTEWLALKQKFEENLIRQMYAELKNDKEKWYESLRKAVSTAESKS